MENREIMRYETENAESLEAIIRSASSLREIRKSNLGRGDWVFVRTVGSLYRIHALGGGVYEISGGWFDKKGLSPSHLRISGCTWGGSAIKSDVVAACGLRIEFGNRLITSPIQRIHVIPLCSQN